MTTPKEDSLRPSLSVGQLAKRWGVSVERIKRLVDAGKLPGSFTIPSAGRYGKAVRIPAKTVRRAEADWAPVARAGGGEPRRTRRRPQAAGLRHFPELDPLPDDGCPEDAPG